MSSVTFVVLINHKGYRMHPALSNVHRLGDWSAHRLWLIKQSNLQQTTQKHALHDQLGHERARCHGANIVPEATAGLLLVKWTNH